MPQREYLRADLQFQMKNVTPGRVAFLIVDVFLVAYLVTLICGYCMTASSCAQVKRVESEYRLTAELAEQIHVCGLRNDPVNWLILGANTLFRWRLEEAQHQVAAL
jgi:hypothetical protein